MKYFIVANRAFNSRKDAEKFCIECDFDFDLIVEAILQQKYFELYVEMTKYGRGCYSYFTEAETKHPHFKEYLQDLKDGQRQSKFIHFKEVSEIEYLKHKA